MKKIRCRPYFTDRQWALLNAAAVVAASKKGISPSVGMITSNMINTTWGEEACQPCLEPYVKKARNLALNITDEAWANLSAMSEKSGRSVADLITDQLKERYIFGGQQSDKG